MPVTVEVPTGAEVRAHLAEWEARDEADRPPYPVEYQDADWRWFGYLPSLADIPNDDTPIYLYRLVPLPVPVGEGWRRPVDNEEKGAAYVADVSQVHDGSEWRPITGFDPMSMPMRVPAGWAPGREAVTAKGAWRYRRSVDGHRVETWDTGHVRLADDSKVRCDAEGRIWVDPLPPEPETAETAAPITATVVVTYKGTADQMRRLTAILGEPEWIVQGGSDAVGDA